MNKISNALVVITFVIVVAGASIFLGGKKQAYDKAVKARSIAIEASRQNARDSAGFYDCIKENEANKQGAIYARRCEFPRDIPIPEEPNFFDFKSY